MCERETERGIVGKRERAMGGRSGGRQKHAAEEEVGDSRILARGSSRQMWET